MRDHLYTLIAGYATGWALLLRAPRLPRRPASIDVPVTVVIPARNEARRLPHLLDALLPGLPPQVRVVVVDDHSTDGTAEIARARAGVTVVPAPALPEGWLGKPWACHVGAADAAPGDLAFLDADVRLSSEALARVLALRRERGGLLSVWPHHVAERPYEQLNALLHVATLMFVGGGGLFPSRPTGALGPVMVTTTEDLARVGGYGGVRGEHVEDLVLGRRFAAAGLPVTVVRGGRDVSVRMYGEGIRGLVAGWRRNLAGALRAVPPARMALIVFWLASSLGALTWGGGTRNTSSLVFAGLFALQITYYIRHVGDFAFWNGLVYPLHVVFCACVFAAGAWSALGSRRIRWRGRDVRAGGE